MQHFLARLEFLLGHEMKFRGSAQLNSPENANSNLAITSGMRDGSAHVLRCLKVSIDFGRRILSSISIS